MRKVFKDNELEAKFQKDGYVIIPFLNESEVEALKGKYFETLPESGGNIGADDAGIKDKITYDFTFIDKNIDYKKLIYDLITIRFKDKVDHYLDNYKPIIANYIRKKSKEGEVPLHQNWAFVDERKYTSVSIWCPLVDSNELNGTLQVVPGSQKRYGEIRGPMIPWELENIKHDIIKNSLVPMNLKAGQAVVLCDSIVHYSALNLTDDLRLAIQLILIPEEVSSIHYHMDPEKSKEKVDVLEVDKEFYMHFNPWKKAEHVKRLKTISYRPLKLSMQNFEKKIYGHRFDEQQPRKNIIEKFKAIFNE